ncbi:2OG-Fe(II) oxygenase [Paucibacter sp. PLA-PC-4]|uniref:2OG-Fe(II) oxygenase n=1 Tax=Paucibacter sp. PLA-PC-4 TaxID=2993655 RepID=UPI0022498794|nr:2OG-Fe(II) oxygenase [Paucibacter sp. PLA-PC-4]MCX2861583.1 2OG-Fe(II) oxygenase [Paucibacter sp. PLA-PC-4]
MLKFEMIGIGVYVVRDFLSGEECEAQIAQAEALGFESAGIERGGEGVVDLRVRNNDRAIVQEDELAANLWKRVGPVLPERMMGRRLVGLNPRLRYYRYVPGQRFRWHADGPVSNSHGHRSILTFMIYLNDGYQGGGTRFRWTEVVPERGMALVFDHDQSHEGAEVISGTKYVLRSDVMSEGADD